MALIWKPARASHWRYEPDDFGTLMKAAEQAAEYDKSGKPQKHYLTGKRGSVFVGPKNKLFYRKRRGDQILRGDVRPAVTKDFGKEAVYSNQQTSPIVDVPTVVATTMQLDEADMRKLRANDLAAYWFLFAVAREQGIEKNEHKITVSALSKHLGVASLDRIRLMLQKLGQTKVSHHFNQPDSRGRRSMALVGITMPVGDDEKLKGAHTVRFTLPSELRNAVLRSRGFGYVHINALPRLKSKFSVNLFVLQSIRAGMTALYRHPITMTEAKFKSFVGLPSDCTEAHFSETLRLIDADFQAVNGPRKTFDTVFERLIDGATAYVRIFVGGSAFEHKTIEALRPWLRYELPDGCMPSVRRLQELATIRRCGLVKLGSEWVIDVYDAHLEASHNMGAKRHPMGMLGANFLAFIDRVGLDAALEAWADHRGFINPIRHRKPPKKRDRRRREKVVQVIFHPSEARVLQIPPDNRGEEPDGLELYDGVDSPYDDEMPALTSDPRVDDDDIPW